MIVYCIDKSKCKNVLSAWSRGMIPASGAGGPGFKPRSGPLEENDTVTLVCLDCVAQW